MPYERYELLERQVTSFQKAEEAMLKHVKNRSILKEDLLPSAKEVKAAQPDWISPSSVSRILYST